MLTFIPILEHSWSRRPSCLPGAERLCTQGICFLPECLDDFICTKSTRKTIPCDVCEENQHIHEQNELNLCEFESHDATTISNSSWMIMSRWVRTLRLCLVLVTIFLSVSHSSPSVVTKLSSSPSGGHRVNRWTRNAGERHRENYYYEDLAFSWPKHRPGV